jgi:hypothetical protein
MDLQPSWEVPDDSMDAFREIWGWINNPEYGPWLEKAAELSAWFNELRRLKY